MPLDSAAVDEELDLRVELVQTDLLSITAAVPVDDGVRSVRRVAVLIKLNAPV